MDRDIFESSDQFVIRLDFNTSGTIVQLPSSLHNAASQWMKASDAQVGIDLHCYDNDDYLFVASLFLHAQTVYRRMGTDPVSGQWLENCRDIPHTVVFLRERPAVATDENNYPITDENGMFVPDDRKLNAGVGGPYYSNEMPYYVLQFDRYMLQRFVIFLQDVFDKNEELIFSFENGQIQFEDGRTGKPDENFLQFPLVSKDEMFRKAQDLYRTGLVDLGHALMVQSAFMSDDERVPDPNITFWHNTITGEDKLIGFSYADQASHRLYIPIRKKIYNTSGFFNFFARRTTLITELFVESMRMLIYHEFFHIANGHGLLSEADPNYASQRDIMICAEQNADDSAIRMMVCELLIDTVDGNPSSAKLKYKRDELIHNWSIRIFASYLALSWIHRRDDRSWNEDTLDNYIANREADHPIYQFRTYNILNRAFQLLETIVQHGERCVTTVEGSPVDTDVIQQTIAKTKDLLNSFEASFRMTYEDTRPMEQQIVESWKAERRSIPRIPQEVPYLMVTMMDRAAEENAQISRMWTDLQNHLREVGAYNIRFSSI